MTDTPEVRERELGLDGRFAQGIGPRMLNPGGRWNVRRLGRSWIDWLSPYHTLMTMHWGMFFALVAGCYSIANVIFASLYYAAGPNALRGAEDTPLHQFADAFFFSVQTLSTIGYGHIAPNNFAANAIAAVEALTGLLGFALITGLLFARFSRPVAKILFSRNALIAPYHGGKALMFRLSNQRRNELSNLEATVLLALNERTQNGRERRFHPLKLERPRIVFLPLHWVIVHPIDEESPLWGFDCERFETMQPELLVLVTAVDETAYQTVHVQNSYTSDEIVWGGRFRSMFVEDTDRLTVDLRRLHDFEEIEIDE